MSPKWAQPPTEMPTVGFVTLVTHSRVYIHERSIRTNENTKCGSEPTLCPLKKTSLCYHAAGNSVRLRPVPVRNLIFSRKCWTITNYLYGIIISIHRATRKSKKQPLTTHRLILWGTRWPKKAPQTSSSIFSMTKSNLRAVVISTGYGLSRGIEIRIVCN